jgi:parvulin-like peptidyl-prolyl isomerase
MLKKYMGTAGLIIILLGAGWLFLGCGDMSADAAARVDGNEISKDDVAKRVSLNKVLSSTAGADVNDNPFDSSAPGAGGSSLPPGLANQITAQQLVTEEIDLLELKKRGISVSDDEITAKTEEIIDTQYQGETEKMQENLAQEGLTQADLRGLASADLIRQKLSDSFRAEVQVSEDEVRAIYQSRLSSYVTPEKRQIRQVVVADEATAQSIADRIAAGGNMTVIASQESIDSTTAVNAGRTKLVLKEELPSAVGDMAFSLPLNQISAPFQSELGWYVIRVELINPASNLAFEDVRDELTEAVVNSKLNERVESYKVESPKLHKVEYAAGYVLS